MVHWLYGDGIKRITGRNRTKITVGVAGKRAAVLCGAGAQNRALAGGHSAPADQLQKIHEASLRNLPKAIREMDRIQVYDNSAPDRRPKRVLSAQSGKVTYLHPSPPEWLEVVLAGSEFQIHE